MDLFQIRLMFQKLIKAMTLVMTLIAVLLDEDEEEGEPKHVSSVRPDSRLPSNWANFSLIVLFVNSWSHANRSRRVSNRYIHWLWTNSRLSNIRVLTTHCRKEHMVLPTSNKDLATSIYISANMSSFWPIRKIAGDTVRPGRKKADTPLLCFASGQGITLSMFLTIRWET
jgi:hypothetical protein